MMRQWIARLVNGFLQAELVREVMDFHPLRSEPMMQPPVSFSGKVN